MRILLSIILIITALASSAGIKEVKQDGTGDYTGIQEAIDHVALPGDTILVWPGTYFENIDFKGKKDLTLASLMLNSGDAAYKYNTIIDGGQNGSCIRVVTNEDNAVIFGFTIQNGKSKEGGGIYIFGSSANIRNCIIKDNISTSWGAGLYCGFDSELFIGGNSIFNNHSYSSAGGILVTVDSYCVFDSINLNNIYLNYAERGCDLVKTVNSIIPGIILDTCTVLDPDTYFIISLDLEGYPLDNLNIEVQNSILEPYDGDLYVNPISGNDGNSGITIDDPLRTIAFAYSKIYIDSLDKNTIHLANGIYSDSTNNEKLPLNIRPFIIVEGESRDGTILDGDRIPYLACLIKGNNNITDFGFKKMTLRGGSIPDYDKYYRSQLARLYTGCDRFELDSIAFVDSYAFDAAGVLTYYQADSSVVKNCLFKDNVGGHSIRTASDGNIVQFINNCIFTNQQPDENVPPNRLKMGKAIDDGGTGMTIVQNSLFYKNPRMGVSRWAYGDSYFINCTFADNSWYDNKTFIYTGDANTHLYNCIAWNLYDVPIAIDAGEWQKMYHSNLNIYNSLIEGGEESISTGSSCWHDDTLWCHVYYDSTNIDADPMFLGMWDHPYMIADGSPCIDAGTLANLPDFIELPEYDLAGNPRIVGDSIDMGAYEWNPTIVGFHDIGPGEESVKQRLLKASPNPFRENTLIELKGQDYKSQPAQIEVYDNYGRQVRNILSTALAGKQDILWYGNDNDNNPLPSGIYYIVVFQGDKEIESLKVVKN
ncbi:MAG: DUF1565 domain-containing protein [Chlorobi bacterium]|nr:DUF1565 domain-containing protein [Chlorobiota bacterium]